MKAISAITVGFMIMSMSFGTPFTLFNQGDEQVVFYSLKVFNKLLDNWGVTEAQKEHLSHSKEKHIKFSPEKLVICRTCNIYGTPGECCTSTLEGQAEKSNTRGALESHKEKANRGDPLYLNTHEALESYKEKAGKGDPPYFHTRGALESYKEKSGI